MIASALVFLSPLRACYFVFCVARLPLAGRSVLWRRVSTRLQAKRWRRPAAAESVALRGPPCRHACCQRVQPRSPRSLKHNQTTIHPSAPSFSSQPQFPSRPRSWSSEALDVSHSSQSFALPPFLSAFPPLQQPLGPRLALHILWQPLSLLPSPSPLSDHFRCAPHIYLL